MYPTPAATVQLSELITPAKRSLEHAPVLDIVTADNPMPVLGDRARP